MYISICGFPWKLPEKSSLLYLESETAILEKINLYQFFRLINVVMTLSMSG